MLLNGIDVIGKLLNCAELESSGELYAIHNLSGMEAVMNLFSEMNFRHVRFERINSCDNKPSAVVGKSFYSR